LSRTPVGRARNSWLRTGLWKCVNHWVELLSVVSNYRHGIMCDKRISTGLFLTHIC
jgi:hypothetical protein